MGRLVIRDDALWIKHIEDVEITRKILALPQNAPVLLRIDGRLARFLKMRDGRDGRPTHGLRPDPVFKPFWEAMQKRRGETVSISYEDRMDPNPYLSSISVLLEEEWSSPEDCKAYDGL